MARPLSSPYSLELGYSFNINLGKNLELFRHAVMRQDWDCVILVDGKEGSGKSVLAMQIAHFLDVDREIDLDTQVCYYPDQFKKAVLSLKKFKAIVWDEARRGLNRRRSTQDVNLEITDLLAECRQHNLFLIIVMPSFYDMDLNVAVHRSRALVHVMYDLKGPRSAPLRRGYYRFYNEDGKKSLYTNKHLRMSYLYPVMPGNSFEGKFPNQYLVDEADYRDRKKEAELAYRRGGSKVPPNRCPECGNKQKYVNRTEKIRVCHCGNEWPLEEKRGSASVVSS